MIREDFLRGYLLLTTQPWGKLYRTVSEKQNGEPSPAEIQLELYYQVLGMTHATVWQQACAIHAMGNRWPSVDDLKITVQQHSPILTALPAPQQTNRDGYFSKDEFGRVLYETISTIGSLLGLREQMAVAIHAEQPEKLPDLQKRHRGMQQLLAKQLPTLNNDEMDRVLVQYPWIVAV